jgi:hypothetical protein
MKLYRAWINGDGNAVVPDDRKLANCTVVPDDCELPVTTVDRALRAYNRKAAQLRLPIRLRDADDWRCMEAAVRSLRCVS